MSQDKKINLFGLSEDELKQVAADLGEKPFRGRQLYNWIYEQKAGSFDEMGNLPKAFREKLDRKYQVFTGIIERKQVDPEDGTIKYLTRLDDGEFVESVLMEYEHGNSICLSTQVGCNMGCTFCASGLGGKVRDLTAAEIAGQIVSAEKDSGRRVSNVVLMGMGEPLDNFDEVIRFIELANKELGIGQRHITLSTCGLVPGIERLGDLGLQINLAVSLHSPFQTERAKIMPVARAFPIDRLIQACDDYFDKTGRRVTYEYTLIDGVNDRPEDVAELKKLVGGKPHHINLIPLNSVTETNHKRSHNVNLFASELKKLGLNSTIRRKNGSNIDAACGQLRRNSMR
ncbi:MAG: 23S rRNA (adenine(2503)-C(2))-methyltransferase RlmN [Eubacteriaceae bacterium]|jgi:23S rRNA (adenine2503-C2)-methyltransferase